MSGYQYVVSVKTGEYIFAGTDANVSIVLHDNDIFTEPLNLNTLLHNNFETGQIDIFHLPREKTKDIGNLSKIEIFRDNSGFGSSWFVERITVKNRSTGDEYIFPVFRWLRPHYHYIFREHDTSLPQDDEQKEQRKLDLVENKIAYEIDMTDLDFPAMITSLPMQERFSNEYLWDFVKLKYTMIVASKVQILRTAKWKTMDDMKSIYTSSMFYEPKFQTKYWREDWFFGYQRLNGTAPDLIRLCTHIPEKLAVDHDDLTPFLEGKSVEQALEAKTLFYCDLFIIHGIQRKGFNHTIPAPIVLLYRNQDNQLLPIAIQLYQEPSPDNPVFFPSDDECTWLLAKMWYNHAETTYHESMTHLGYTHLMMEGVSLALHRNVSVSHPVFKLLAPHLIYLLAINNRALRKMLSEGEWVDKTMAAGKEGVIEATKRGFKVWRMNVEGSTPDDLLERGVYDKDVLPDYHYRDDALLLYGAIYKFVQDYVNLYYDSPSKLQEDTEMQDWRREMIMSRSKGGMAIHGIPGNGEFNEVGQLVKALTAIIFACSVQHAASNFPQYDYYGFIPCYPINLRGDPPADKRPRTEDDLVKSMPDKGLTFDTMVITKLLSNKATNSLGDYEIQYMSDPRAKRVLQRFQEDLKGIGKTIDMRNESRRFPYDYLHPEFVPNAISV